MSSSAMGPRSARSAKSAREGFINVGIPHHTPPEQKRPVRVAVTRGRVVSGSALLNWAADEDGVVVVTDGYGVPWGHATNWRAETGIRPAVVVVYRKVWGGNRTNRGADTQQILMTIFRTALQQGHDIIATFTDLLLSPTPSVAPFTGLTHHLTG